jgi:multiple sugar transport system ATP-binding protein
MSTVRLECVTKSFAETVILQGVDLRVEDREFVVIVGPSGCGKTTLLRLIAGLETITAGDLWIDGVRVNDVAPARRGLALVFQSYALYPHMTVEENMAFSLKLAGVPKAERRKKVEEAARILHLQAFLDRKPKELSGGQRQRVAIGRAIVRHPKVFLFDEPLSNLDAELRVRTRLELMKLHKQLQATIIYVTHDQTEAMTMADRIVVMHGGAIEQIGSPLEVYLHPANRFVAGFVGSPKMNFLSATVVELQPGQAMIRLKNGYNFEFPFQPEGTGRTLKMGDTVEFGIRPEHISLEQASGVRVRVNIVERLGGEAYLHTLTEQDEALAIKVDGETPVQEDESIGIRINLPRSHLFGPAGEAIAWSAKQG